MTQPRSTEEICKELNALEPFAVKFKYSYDHIILTPDQAEHLIKWMKRFKYRD